MAENEAKDATNSGSSALSDLVSGVVGDARGFVVGGIMQGITNAILHGSDASKVEDELNVISEQLNEIEQTAQAILAEIGYLDTAIEEALVGEEIKVAVAKIQSAHVQMGAFLKAMQDGLYEGESETLRRNYLAIAQLMQQSLPDATALISENAIRFMELLREQLRESKTDVLNYNLALCYALQKLAAPYRKAIDVMEFSRNAFPYVGVVIEKIKEQIVVLEKWKNTEIDGALTPLVVALVDGNTPSFTIDKRVACYGDADIDDIGDSDGSYWLHIEKHMVQVPPMSEEGESNIIVSKVDDFDIQNPVFFLESIEWQNAINGKNKEIGIRNLSVGDDEGKDGLVMDEYDDSDSKKWQLLCCQSDAVPAPILKDFLCIYNPCFDGYTAIGELHPILKDFSKGDNQQFWRIK